MHAHACTHEFATHAQTQQHDRNSRIAKRSRTCTRRRARTHALTRAAPLADNSGLSAATAHWQPLMLVSLFVCLAGLRCKQTTWVFFRGAFDNMDGENKVRARNHARAQARTRRHARARLRRCARTFS
jgi:hypothetical protein